MKIAQIVVKPAKKENDMEKKGRVKNRTQKSENRKNFKFYKRTLKKIKILLNKNKSHKNSILKGSAFYHKEEKPVPENLTYFNIQRYMMF